jgi:hypothetical protein
MNALSHGRSASWDLRRPSCRTPVRPFGSSRAPIRIHRGTDQGPGRALVTIFVDDLDRQIALSAARGLERARSMRLTTTAYARSPSVTPKVLSARSYSAAARWPRTRLRRKRRPKPLGTLPAPRAMPRTRPTCSLSQKRTSQTHPGRRSTRSTRSEIGSRRGSKCGCSATRAGSPASDALPAGRRRYTVTVDQEARRVFRSWRRLP